jgi:NAD(P)-dependent dehydrogenase (short-subunit alcohol dehydrogenase family)
MKLLLDETVKKYGRIDVLVNNAGVNFVKPFEKVEADDWDKVINTDLSGTYLCSWYAVPYMLKLGNGSIINITTVHTLGCFRVCSVRCCKMGYVGLTKSLLVSY